MKRLIVILTLCLLCGCSTESSKQSEEANDNKELKWQEMLKNFSERYNAILDWSQKFDKREFDIYTVDLQHYLTQKNRSPIVVQADVKDIFSKKDSYIIELHDYLGIGTKEIYYELKANVNLVNQILKNSSWIAAIVQLDSISKAVKFRIENLEYEAYLEQNDVLVFHGTCIDILPYPEN